MFIHVTLEEGEMMFIEFSSLVNFYFLVNVYIGRSYCNALPFSISIHCICISLFRQTVYILIPAGVRL